MLVQFPVHAAELILDLSQGIQHGDHPQHDSKCSDYLNPVQTLFLLIPTNDFTKPFVSCQAPWNIPTQKLSYKGIDGVLEFARIPA
jgi:hypothetical protein